MLNKNLLKLQKLMKFYLKENQTEIIFKKFKSGKQKAKVNRSFSFVNRNNYEN